jgi:hypothetical protein
MMNALREARRRWREIVVMTIGTLGIYLDRPWLVVVAGCLLFYWSSGRHEEG